MPDWKNKNDYPTVNKTSIDKWAYEFLCRNKAFHAELLDAQNADAKDKRPEIPSYETQTYKVCEKYGVAFLVHDGLNEHFRLDSPFIFDAHPKIVRLHHSNNVDGVTSEDSQLFYMHPISDIERVLAFDISQPLTPQIDRAKKLLQHAQKIYGGSKRVLGKSIVNLYPYYLRVLDALEAGVNSSKICEVLSLDYSLGVSEDTLRNWRKEAERLRDGGYLDIVRNPKP